MRALQIDLDVCRSGSPAGSGSGPAVYRGYHSHLRKYGWVQIWAEPNYLGSYQTVLPLHQLLEDGSMFDFAIAVVALSSASIFFAHAVELFLTQ
jgi:hypothetical protein